MLKNALERAYNAGIMLVAASGNDGTTANLYPVRFPARHESVIAVSAAYKENGVINVGDFSCYGEEVELAAPGVDILSTYSDNNPSTVNQYAYNTGTSMAAPMVTGTAALLLAYNEYFKREYRHCYGYYPSTITSVDDYRNILKETAIDINQYGFDIYSGYGLIDAYAAVSYLKSLLMGMNNGFDPAIGIPPIVEDPLPPPTGPIEPPNPPPPMY